MKHTCNYCNEYAPYQGTEPGRTHTGEKKVLMYACEGHKYLITVVAEMPLPRSMTANAPKQEGLL